MNINQIIEQHALWLGTDGAEGSRANLASADLMGSDLTDTNLTRANLACANLACANLAGANLEGANLAYTNLTCVNMSYANLAGANLEGANLTDVNLTYANLTGAIGNFVHLKSIFCDTYHVTYTAEVMQIGCERHKLEDWWSFGDDRIIAMYGKTALEWWRIWKPILQQIIAASPATATGYVARDPVTKSWEPSHDQN